MKSEVDYEKASVFEQIRGGLKDIIAHQRGEITLKTTTLPSPAPTHSKKRVVAIRKRLGMSQGVFAAYLNVPAKTLQSWEQGARVPKAGEARLLQVAAAFPDEFVRIVLSAESPGSDSARKSPRPRRVKKKAA